MFKKGDRVKVIAYPNCINQKDLLGQTGTIIEKPTKDALKGDDFIKVKLDDWPEDYYFFEDELEIIKEEK